MNCPICEAPVLDYAPGVSCVKIAGLSYHPECYEAETGMEIIGDILDKQLRKSLEPVIWEGKTCCLGSLTTQERMNLTRNAQGILEGGYPL